MLDRVSRWRDYLLLEQQQADLMSISRHNRTRRPAGSNEFIENLEQVTGRYLKKKKPGPKPKLEK
jgi:putative transposase